MVMKVFPKGQVVIPAALRRELGIAIGDMLDVTVDHQKGIVVLQRHQNSVETSLAGSLARYAQGKDFPSKRQMSTLLEEGLANEF
jgi:AbrB family looped-hinge helix DNA binding protein